MASKISRIDAIAYLVGEGWTDEQISILLVSRLSSVRRIVRQLHGKITSITGRPKRVFARDQALKLRNDGLSFRTIAKILDIPLSTAVSAIKPQSEPLKGRLALVAARARSDPRNRDAIVLWIAKFRRQKGLSTSFYLVPPATGKILSGKPFRDGPISMT